MVKVCSPSRVSAHVTWRLQRREDGEMEKIFVAAEQALGPPREDRE